LHGAAGRPQASLGDGTILTMSYQSNTAATHWAPMPAPPQGDE